MEILQEIYMNKVMIFQKLKIKKEKKKSSL